RCIHANQGSHTRATWVCCSITSDTSTPQAVVSGSRQGSFRAFCAYQSRMRVRTWWMWVSLSWSVADDIDTMVVPSRILAVSMAKLGIMSDQQLPPRQSRPRKIPPHILRRRRIVAVIILLIILALIGWGIWALIGLFLPDDDEQATPQPQPTVTETVSPSSEESEDDDDDEPSADACDPEMLTVIGATDQE